MRREETLRVLGEREKISRDVPVIANERSVATESEEESMNLRDSSFSLFREQLFLEDRINWSPW